MLAELLIAGALIAAWIALPPDGTDDTTTQARHRRATDHRAHHGNHRKDQDR